MRTKRRLASGTHRRTLFGDQYPPDILMVRFTPDDVQPNALRPISIQPTPQ